MIEKIVIRGVLSVLLGLAMASLNQAYSQTDFTRIKRKKLFPAHIDTLHEATIIIEKRNAVLGFRQSDIKRYLSGIDTSDLGNKLVFNQLSALFDQSRRTVRLVDFWYDYSDQERARLSGSSQYNRTDEQYLTALYYPAAELILAGKFMIVSKPLQQEITKGLKARRITGIMGSKSLSFRLPDNRTFWTITTVLGE
jgi:hypothetical protein